jgi:gas vesicle protein
MEGFLMAGSKFGKMVLIGALTGAVISMFDRTTRSEMSRRAMGLGEDAKYYMKNPDVLRWKIQDKSDKLKALYEQFDSDKQYLQSKASELKQLTPTVKTLVEDTKTAFVDSKDTVMEAKDDYKQMATEAFKNNHPGTDQTFVPEEAYAEGQVDGGAKSGGTSTSKGTFVPEEAYREGQVAGEARDNMKN